MSKSTVQSADAYQEEVLKVEPYGIEQIPGRERHGRARQMFSIWFAINLNVVTWFTGFIGVELGLPLKWAILGLLIGNLTGAVLLALTSAVGPKLGRPLIPASRKAFGKAGVFGLSFLNFVNNVGWLAVNLVLAVMAFQKIFPVLGYQTSLLILTAGTVLIAVYGYNFIHSFAHWMSILMGVLFVIMTVITVHNLPDLLAAAAPAAGAPAGFNLGMFILTIAIAFSYQISYCPIGSDYSRYLPENTSQSKTFAWSYLGTFSVTIWLEILGALTATLNMSSAGPMDFFAKIMGAFTIPALIAVIFSILPVNAMAIYSGGLAALAMGIPMKRWTTAIVAGGLGALLVSFGSGEIADTYKNFLIILSYWVVPWTGVVLADVYFRSKITGEDSQIYGFAGIIAFVCGVAVSVPFMSTHLYTGPIAANYLGGADISYFLSPLVSTGLYLGILKLKAAGAVGEPSLETENA